MKRFLALSLLLAFNFMIAYVIGCTPKGTPVVTTFTSSYTPGGGPTATPGTATFPVLYNDGGMSPIVSATNFFAGGGSPGYPSTNALDSATLGGYGGDNYGYLCQWTSGEVSAMAGYSGLSLAGSSTDFSPYTTCKFWAKANQSASVGFNAAEPPGDTANTTESLTTSWTQYTLTITSGSRTDGQGGAITAVSTFFVEVITSAPGSTPLIVNFDQVTFQ